MLHVLQGHLLPSNRFISVCNCTGAQSSHLALSPALRAQKSSYGADETRYSFLPSVSSCVASSSLTQPSHGFREVTTVRDSHTSLLATQFFSVQKLLQGKILKSPIFLEPSFPHTLLHCSLILTLCYYKNLQVCAAQIH